MHIDFPLDIQMLPDASALTDELDKHLRQLGDSYIVISGARESFRYASKLLDKAKVRPAAHYLIKDNDITDVYNFERRIRGDNASIIVAVGGGKVGDFAKRLAYLRNIPLLLVPTIIGNDGLISPIAVLKDGDISVSMPGRMPDAVLIDIQLLKAAPTQYLRAAACDLITNLSATNDWELARSNDTSRVNHLALQMSRMAAEMILNHPAWDIESPELLKSIIYGQMLSGVAMTIAGSSRPCSGSEHLIAHALDAKSVGMWALHGEKVGITSRFCLYLQKMTDHRAEAFFKALNVPKIFPGCESLRPTEIATLFSVARIMRPGRTTILDQYSDEELAIEYFKFIGCQNGQ